MNTLKKIGLTGGIGAGKSEVASQLRREGILVVDLDQLGRELTQDNPELVRQIGQLLGQPVSRPGSPGQLDRARLKEILFSDAGLRTQLERLLHPLILQKFQKAGAEAQAAGHRLIVCEAALLVESGYISALDALVVISATVEIRKHRLIARDGLDESLAEKIFQAQVSEDERRKHAQWILVNEGDRDELSQKVQELIHDWKARGWL